MLIIPAPQNELKHLVNAYNELLEVRRNAIGVVMSENCVENWDWKESLKTRFADLALDTRLGKSSIRNTYFKLFKKQSYNSVTILLEGIEEKKTQYMNQTNQRSRYGIITPMAFCNESEIPLYLDDSLGHTLDLTRTWSAEFQQLSAENTNIGLLEMVGVSRSDLTRWWSGSESDAVRKETRVWEDVKNLSLKLVLIFDKISRDWNLLSMVKLNDGESQDRVNNVIPQLKTIGQNLIRLLYIRQDNLDDIIPLYEMLVPVVYAFRMTLSLGVEEWQTFGSKAILFLEAYVSNMRTQRDALVEYLNASEEMRNYYARDSRIIPTSRQHSRETKEELHTPEHREDKKLLRDQITEALKDIGLIERHVVVSDKEPIGNGSFAIVRRCHEEHGRQQLAAKFLKLKPNNPERVKNRILREATIWSKLRNEKFNTLLGFCIDPYEDFPGLLSPYREWTLATYLKTHKATASDPEKLCYLYEIACGLAHMHNHEEKLAHGDLRPQNVLLVPEQLGNGYKAVLSDFGVSYAEEDTLDLDLTTLQHTNHLYLAPELLSKSSGKERMVTTYGDIYAFGCVFTEVMYNQSPYYYYASSTIQLRTDKKKHNLLPALEKDIEKRHWEFLKKTWDPKPRNRPSADRLMLDMHNFKM